MKKRGQIATEYLYVYGWAIFTIMIVTGLMIEFDFFNMSNFRVDSCYTGSQLSCEEAQLQTNGELAINLQNNHPVNIRITNITSSLFEEMNHEINEGIARGENELLRFNVSNQNLGEGSKYDIALEITFSRDEDGANTYTTKGEVRYEAISLD